MIHLGREVEEGVVEMFECEVRVFAGRGKSNPGSVV